MALKIGKGWRGESHRHSLARKGIKTGRTPTTPTLSPRVSGYAKRFNKGVEIERKEHPTLSNQDVESLVRDHLNENPNYYKNNPNRAESLAKDFKRLNNIIVNNRQEYKIKYLTKHPSDSVEQRIFLDSTKDGKFYVLHIDVKEPTGKDVFRKRMIIERNSNKQLRNAIKQSDKVFKDTFNKWEKTSNPNTKAEKYERCVKKVKKQKRVKSPQAVCRASVYGKSKFDVAREERRKGIIK